VVTVTNMWIDSIHSSTDSGAVSLFAQNMLGEFDITAKFIGNPQAEDC